MTWIIIFSCYC